MKVFPQSDQSGLSLLELLVVIGVVSLLIVLVTPISSTFKERAEKAKCLSHMRSLHTCFTAHLTDKGFWPQLPVQDEGWTEDKFFRFWVATLEPYGATEETWLCPSDKLFQQVKKSELEKDRYFGSYLPTPFDEAPSTPFRWNQPWIIERGDFHGRGGHMLMPDGSIHDSQNPFNGR